jgi:hypothetical protein
MTYEQRDSYNTIIQYATRSADAIAVGPKQFSRTDNDGGMMISNVPKRSMGETNESPG